MNRNICLNHGCFYPEILIVTLSNYGVKMLKILIWILLFFLKLM